MGGWLAPTGRAWTVLRPGRRLRPRQRRILQRPPDQPAPDLRICRLLSGLWQLSGAHGPIEREAALRNMFDYLDAGFTTFDLADHYGPAEDLIGELRRRLADQRGAAALSAMQAFTKWVP